MITINSTYRANTSSSMDAYTPHLSVSSSSARHSAFFDEPDPKETMWVPNKPKMILYKQPYFLGKQFVKVWKTILEVWLPPKTMWT